VDENLCVLGQRNDPSTGAIPEILDFHLKIGRRDIQERVIQLNSVAKKLLKERVPTAVLVTPVSPEFSAGVTIFTLKDKDPSAFVNDLYKRFGIAGAPSGGIRLSPNIYNTLEDIEYVVDCVRQLATG